MRAFSHWKAVPGASGSSSTTPLDFDIINSWIFVVSGPNCRLVE